MLSCPSHYHLHPPHLSLLLRPNPISATISSCLRRHNSKSAALLLRHLSQDPISTPQHHEHSIPDEEEEEEEEEETLKLLQLSLATKRTPQFPGSIYAQSPSDPDVHSSLPPLRTLLRGKPEDDDD
jgi:mTERF domain-containing protein